MNLDEIRGKADDYAEHDFERVKMNALIHIATSLKRLNENLEFLTLVIQD